MPEPRSDIATASARVAAIVEAAERAAEELRAETEQRARERIAEATRAADLRVAAAEAEVAELLSDARRDAGAEAAAARTAASELRKEADRYAEDVRSAARTDAREAVRDAHGAAEEVLRQGKELAINLNALSDSLRRNAERLLNDVKFAHGRLTGELERAVPAGQPAPSSARAVRGGPELAAPRRASDAVAARDGVDGRRRSSRGRGTDGTSDADAEADVLIRAARAAEAGTSLEELASPRARRDRDEGDEGFDIPEFVPGRR